MTQMQFLLDYLAWVLNVIFWVSITTPVIWGAFWPWWLNPWGRNLVSYDVCISLGFLGYILNHDWGIPVHYVLVFFWLQNISLSFIPVLIAWRTIIIWRTQKQAAIKAIAEENDGK